MNNHDFTSNSFDNYIKGNQIFFFLKTIPHVNPFGSTLSILLANKFNLKLETFLLLLKIAATEGGYYEN